MRKTLLAIVSATLAASLHAEKVTLPAASSLIGGNPFYSDVRVFNTSYSTTLNVTATYRCFVAVGGASCPGAPPQVQISLAPRQARSFDDMVADAFGAGNTGGGVEFDYSGNEDLLVVTSRLYSTTPTPTVGMFIAGVSANKAHANSVLTSIRNGGPNDGFRTNAGFYNANDAGATVTFRIFDEGAQVGNAVERTVGGHAGAQVSGIFGAAGQGSHETQNAVIVVTSTVPVFSYAAVLDNHTTDPVFVTGSPDQPLQSNPTPATRTVHVGRGGTNFVDDVSGTSVTTINAGDTVKWVWEGELLHGTHSGTCSGGNPYPYGKVGPQGSSDCTSDGVFSSGSFHTPHDYSFTFTQSGTFRYFCDVHENSMTGRVVVNAAP
jgi:plastocyanin